MFFVSKGNLLVIVSEVSRSRAKDREFCSILQRFTFNGHYFIKQYYSGQTLLSELHLLLNRPFETKLCSRMHTPACCLCMLWRNKRVACTLHTLVLITKTCLYNFDPLKPHFYIVKLRFTGVYIIFLISAQNIDCGYSLEPPR